MIGTIAYSCKQLMDEANKRSLLVGLFFCILWYILNEFCCRNLVEAEAQ